MNCDDVSERLVALQFGGLEAEERGAVEAHLLLCPACVGEHLELVRAATAPDEGLRARPEVRARTRALAARELGMAAAGGARSRWDRPIALAFAAVVVLVANLATRALTRGPGAPPHRIAAEGRAG
jgi:anti-sigma factor RsiW